MLLVDLTYAYAALANAGRQVGADIPADRHEQGFRQFDPVANPTVIDGQNLYRGVYVYSSSSPGVRLTMANVTIQNARAKGIDGVQPTVFGGGSPVCSISLAAMVSMPNASGSLSCAESSVLAGRNCG